jgi:hypothetical protein
MRSERPAGLVELQRDRMHQLATSVAQRRGAARATLGQARDFRRAAAGNLADGLVLPAISALHEAARLAVTAVAVLDGYRFSNTPGAHEAVVDYAIAVQLVDRARYAQLDQLRDLRHQVNYPEDMIAPPLREIQQYTELVDAVLASASAKIPAAKVPPPPR